MCIQENWANSLETADPLAAIWTAADEQQWGNDADYYSDLVLPNNTPAAIHIELINILKDLGFSDVIVKGSSVSEAYASEQGLPHPGANDIDIVIDARSLDSDRFLRFDEDDDQLLQAGKNRIRLSGDFHLKGEAARFTKTDEGYSVASFVLDYHGYEIDINLVTCDVKPDCVLDSSAPVWGIVTDGENVYAHPDFENHFENKIFAPNPDCNVESVVNKFHRKNLGERYGWTLIEPTATEPETTIIPLYPANGPFDRRLAA